MTDRSAPLGLRRFTDIPISDIGEHFAKKADNLARSCEAIIRYCSTEDDWLYCDVFWSGAEWDRTKNVTKTEKLNEDGLEVLLRPVTVYVEKRDGGMEPCFGRAAYRDGTFTLEFYLNEGDPATHIDAWIKDNLPKGTVELVGKHIPAIRLKND